MLFLEPAPYIVAFVDAARRAWPGRIDVLYAAAQISQDWGFDGHSESQTVLPPMRSRAMAEIKRRLSSGQYELMHLAGWGHPLLWRTILYAARRLPVTVQTDTPPPEGEAFWKRAAKKVAYRALFRLPALFTPAGTPQAAYVRSFGVPSSRIRVAQLTVDVAAIQTYSNEFTLDRRAKVRSRLQLANENIAILYVGRLEPHKGIEDLLAAFTTLTGKLPNARLLIAGDGSLRDRTIAAANEIPAIRYLGRLANKKLWEAYNIADVFVLPSRFEPWGLVVNEAMAAGLPVIVTDRVGCGPDLVRHGVTGLVVPAASVTALTTALETMCAETNRRTYMGSQARQLISQWTLANQARNTTAAWRHALTL
jgi:glycosyltransferase involved in cell wall biosynthesis